MIVKIFKTASEYFQFFIIVWVITILVNQIILFNACFAIYCIIAALPHTGIIALLATYFLKKDEANKNKELD